MINFVSLCGDYRIQYLEGGHHHCKEGWVQVHCPFCSNGHSGWHLGFNLEFGNMNCWKCGKHTIKDWLYAVLPTGGKSQVGVILSKYQVKQYKVSKKKVIKVRERDVKPVIGAVDLQYKHIKYLKSRGFNSKILQEVWGLKATCHLSREWNWRILAPIRNSSGRVVAYTGRALGNEVKPRWKTTENEAMAQDPRKLIYGIEKAHINRGVLIVEGPSDVWRMGPGSVGLLGIDWKVEQAAQLRQFKKRFIMFDPAKSAQKRASELAHWLAAFPGQTEIITGLSTDPGDLSQKEAYEIMNELGIRKGNYND